MISSGWLWAVTRALLLCNWLRKRICTYLQSKNNKSVICVPLKTRKAFSLQPWRMVKILFLHCGNVDSFSMQRHFANLLPLVAMQVGMKQHGCDGPVAAISIRLLGRRLICRFVRAQGLCLGAWATYASICINVESVSLFAFLVTVRVLWWSLSCLSEHLETAVAPQFCFVHEETSNNASFFFLPVDGNSSVERGCPFARVTIVVQSSTTHTLWHC